ncbi:MAG TPA: hypothetical protein VFP58_05725 [Candidatus Eisenbacteria bacterium]|nr:hypothetical protein [Candidatus Eisenbacteria bacterium]
MSTKKWIVGVGALVAVALVVAVWKGAFPPQGGMEGTIGAAKRYQSEQLAAGDVALTDSDIQDLLQSDLFHQIVTDASFREMYMKQSEALRTVLTDARFRDLVGKQGFAEVMRSDVFRQAVEQNKYELLQKASATDFQKSRLTTEPTLDKANTTAEVGKTVEASRTQLLQAREDLNKTEDAYEKAVTSLLKTETTLAKSELELKSMAARTALVQAREDLAKAEAEYQRQAEMLGKTQDMLARNDLVQKVQTARAETVQKRELYTQRQAELDRAVTDLGKAAKSQEALNKIETARASTMLARTALSRAQATFDRQVTAAIGSSLERQSTAQDYARAQELSKSETFRQVFADANFRTLAKSEEFSRLVSLERFPEVAKMDAFQKAAQSPEMWKQVASGDAMERAVTMKAAAVTP